MRFTLLGAVATLGLCPAIASAVVMVRTEDVSGAPGQTISCEVFAVPSDGSDERLTGFTIAVDAPSFNVPNGPSFVIPAPGPTGSVFALPTSHPYVFAAFPGNDPVDPAGLSDRDTAFLAAALGQGEANIEQNLRDGFAKLMISIPATALPGQTYAITIDPIFTALGSQGAPIIVTPGTSTLTIVPEPASLGLIGIAGLLALRRRRMA
jgi:hypothetical protein